ncbi:MAG TPA: efflux RND transporter periplasmic adaptor subunit [Leptolyngbyaceae cyanobacterium]
MLLHETGKKRFKSGVKFLVWSGTLAVASAGGWLIYLQNFNRTPETVKVRIIKVELGTIENTINESGTVELGGQQTVKSPMEGAVDRVLVNLGDRIQAGKPLILLRNPDRETILATKQLEIKKQELTLTSNRQKVDEAADKLKIFQQEFFTLVNQRNLQEKTQAATQKLEIREQEITLARNSQKLQESQEQIIAEQKKLAELEILNSKGVIPRKELQEQQEKIRVAQSQLRDAQLQVSTGRLNLEKLQIKTELIPPQIPEKVMLAKNELRQAQLDVSTNIRELEKLKLDLKKSQQELANYLVAAPINGMILDILVKDGDGIDRRTDLLTLGDPAQELVKLKLSTLNAARVKLGKLARISVIGPDPKIYSGRVENLSPLATSGKKESESSSSEQSTQATVSATVKLDTPTRTLIPGSQVNVEIILQKRENVIVLNTEAIQRESATPFVWVKDAENKVRKRTVSLGLEELTNVEITNGLKVGEKVVLPSPENSLQDGTPVIETEHEKEAK